MSLQNQRIVVKGSRIIAHWPRTAQPLPLELGALDGPGHRCGAVPGGAGGESEPVSARGFSMTPSRWQSTTTRLRGAGQEPTGEHRHHGGGQLAPTVLLWVPPRPLPAASPSTDQALWLRTDLCQVLWAGGLQLPEVARVATQGAVPRAGKQWGLWVPRSRVFKASVAGRIWTSLQRAGQLWHCVKRFSEIQSASALILKVQRQVRIFKEVQN